MNFPGVNGVGFICTIQQWKDDPFMDATGSRKNKYLTFSPLCSFPPAFFSFFLSLSTNVSSPKPSHPGKVMCSENVSLVSVGGEELARREFFPLTLNTTLAKLFRMSEHFVL